MTAKQHVFIVIAVTLIPILNAKDIECDTALKPDFKGAGERISEEKCREYTWERSNLDNCSQDAVNTEYPYMGAIGFRRKGRTELSFPCAAFLISPTFAVSVAPCFELSSNNVPEMVRFGHKYLTGEPHIDAKILRSIVHPQFEAPKKAFDIALVEFEEALPLSRSIQPVCLWTKSSLEGIDQGLAPGWGSGLPKDEKQKNTVRNILRVMIVKIPNRESCKSQSEKYYFKNWPQILDHQICGDETDSPTRHCQGSAGVPLITTGDLDGDQVSYAFGVTSFGASCPGGFGIYTSVSSFIDWIEEIVWPQNAK